jgi:hypothetical protein
MNSGDEIVHIIIMRSHQRKQAPLKQLPQPSDRVYIYKKNPRGRRGPAASSVGCGQSQQKTRRKGGPDVRRDVWMHLDALCERMRKYHECHATYRHTFPAALQCHHNLLWQLNMCCDSSAYAERT